MLWKGLEVLSDREMTQLGPEQIIFLKHRPVLDNSALKQAFGYRPARTLREVFAAIAAAGPEAHRRRR